ncbi:hypothetical protein FACS189487_05640 [Campylobacterota bacterium]|nr:hypothetical protein FACS189487_05640 [Campylobacterota bacterium]
MAIGGKYRIAPLNKQEEARLKYELVQEYKRRGPKTLAQMLDVWQIDFKYKQLKINLASVKRWIKQVDEAKQRRIDPLDMLIDTRGKHRKGAIKMSAEMQDIVIKSQLQKEGRPNAKALEYNLKRTFGDEAPNVYAITRLLAAFKEKNKQLVTFANNPGEYKDSCMPAYGNASERADYALKIVELDGTPADVLCADGKRYTILGAIDVFSRRLILTVEERSNSYAVARLLRKVILTLGVPEQVVIDNGKEYTSNHFASICDLLHIYQEIVPPYSGDCKPHIERSFHTVSHEVLPQIPAYIGHNVAAKTAITNRETYEKQQEAKRKFNRSKRAAKNMAAEKAIEYTQDSDLLAIKKDNVGRVLKTALTRDELQGVLDAWIEQVYNARIHTGNGMNLTPIEKWNKTTMPPRMIEDERMLDLLLGQSEIKTVGKKGIRDDNNYYTHAAIAGMGKEEVYILRPDDMGKVIVYDLDMHFICVAIDHEKLGLSREVAREAKNEYRKITKKYAQTVKEATELANKYNTNIIDILAAEPAKSEAVETIRAAVFESAVTRQIKEMNEPINNKEEAGVIDVEATDGERPQFRTIAQKFEWLINHPEDWSIEDTNLIEKHQSLYDETRKRLVA